MYHDMSDEELVNVASTNKQVFPELLSRYVETIDAKAKSFGSSLSDDLFQEGVLAVFSAVKTYDSKKGASFATYVNTCIKNRMLTAVKRQNSNGFSVELDESVDEIYADAPEIIPENVVAARERLNEMHDKISSSLSQLEWNVFRLFFTGLSYDAISQRLGISTKAVDNAMQRIRRKLKTVLGK